jgi:UDP-glucose 4-epimerase
VYIPYDQAYEEGFEDMQRRVPDIAKICRLIGFKPEVGIDEIIDSVIDYYKQ